MVKKYKTIARVKQKKTLIYSHRKQITAHISISIIQAQLSYKLMILPNQIKIIQKEKIVPQP